MAASRVVVRLTPRGGSDGIDGVGADGELLVRVRAVAEAGAANLALGRLLAEQLGIPRGAVTLETGGRSRTKRLRVEGLSPAALVRHWPGVAAVDASDGAAG